MKTILYNYQYFCPKIKLQLFSERHTVVLTGQHKTDSCGQREKCIQ